MAGDLLSGQLVLPVRLDDGATFDNFYIPNKSVNHVTIHSLSDGGQSVYLYGGEGAGVTHLLQAFCRAEEAAGRSTIYIPLKDFSNEKPDQVLANLEALGSVCLDDLDAVSSNSDWSEALFHLFNRAMHSETRLVFGAKCSSTQVSTPLADLKSRLGSLLLCRVEKLSDDELIDALKSRAKRRGMEMSSSVAGFLVTRYSRKLGDQFAALDLLDRASLAEQRKLTIPFIKKVLEP